MQEESEDQRTSVVFLGCSSCTTFQGRTAYLLLLAWPIPTIVILPSLPSLNAVAQVDRQR